MSSWKDRFSKISQRYVLVVLASLCLLLVVVVLAAGSRQADRECDRDGEQQRIHGQRQETCKRSPTSAPTGMR